MEVHYVIDERSTNVIEPLKETDIAILNKKIIELEAQLSIIQGQLSPDKLAKKIDISYLSINNTRLWLQILAAIQTIFVATAVIFGFIGLANINQIRAEAEKVKEMSKTIDESGRNIIDKVRKIDAQLVDIEKLSTAFEKKNKIAKDKVDAIESRTASAINQSEQKLKERLSEAEKKIAVTNAKLRDISQTFNQVSIQYDYILNPREQLLLVLLARKIDPDNSNFTYNSALYSYGIGRYDEAIADFEMAAKSKDVPADVIEKARQGIVNAKWMKDNYKKAKLTNPDLIRIGDYSALQLLLSTIETLSMNGYFTKNQTEKILTESKIISK